MRIYKYISIVALFLSLTGCGFYSFTGVTDTPNSFQVNFFQNNAPLIEPGLDIQFTNALQDLIQNQTSSNLVTSGGEVIFDGEIVEYRISPTTATANNRAAQNRLTIGVNVRYTDTKDEEKNFEQRFSFFVDYDGDALLTGSQRDSAWEEIFQRITQDIFQKAFADW
ncbi:outer membrane lipopolysaccharide assembly protein LptE/RlpB [Winogradskyella wandonensis]|uniref:Outer membrane lipopolysaccharide assembly protein LptE/RlpB n=1 Tax=Winogradskyella wandonensis TaxID=1442586 RepID=A0A4R1KQI3_9FLAO|nr:LptE family protein [Winogradskyella wandonensis]TCK67272.1 outer membrane lipopolysaccharide assembly protein LptE/RlpB [Winogradskyella wandonensis]